MVRILAPLMLSALSIFAGQADATPIQDQLEVVYCHDTARNLIKRVRVRHCEGRVVGTAEASAIHRRIETERRARQTRTLTQSASRVRNHLRFKSAGAAFAVNERGELLTSAHVVRGCDLLEARNNGSLTPHRAKVKAISNDLDLAVVQIGAATPDILGFSNQSPPDGAPLALIGYPSEGMIRRVPSLTPVLISHAVSNPSKFGLIGVAGNVRRGNSGGPALDSRGRAVGVLKAKINTVAAHKLTGRVLTNLGVVVETDRVLSFLTRSRTSHRLDRPDISEKSGRDIFERGRRAVFRIDCLVKN